MTRTTHHRYRDHFGIDLDTSIQISDDVGPVTLSGSTLHLALEDIWDYVTTMSGGSGSNFDDDVTTLPPQFGEGYSFPTGREYIRQKDLGNAGEDAWLALVQGRFQLSAHRDDGVNPDHGQVDIKANTSSAANLDIQVVDDNDYSGVYLTPTVLDLDAGAHVIVMYGQAYRPPTAASAPGSPTEGDTYYDTVTHKTRTWDGSTWQDHW